MQTFDKMQDRNAQRTVSAQLPAMDNGYQAWSLVQTQVTTITISLRKKYCYSDHLQQCLSQVIERTVLSLGKETQQQLWNNHYWGSKVVITRVPASRKTLQLLLQTEKLFLIWYPLESFKSTYFWFMRTTYPNFSLNTIQHWHKNRFIVIRVTIRGVLL